MKFIVGVIVGIIVVPVVLVIYLASGFAPTAATDKPLPFETWIAGTALSKRMQNEAPTRDLSSMTSADLLAGANIYKNNCAGCHGLPDQPPSEIGNDMFPPAPQLMQPPPPRPGGRQPGRGSPPPGAASAQMGTVQGRGASGDFWRVKNGIRLTGMPSFEKTLSDDQMWQVVYLIAKRRNLPPEAKAALVSDGQAAAPTPAEPPVKSEAPAKHR